MSAVFGRCAVWACGMLIAVAYLTVPAQADTVTVSVDRAHVMRLPEKVATIIIGNPLIADASLQRGGILIVTGKSYGETNLLALDRAGHVVMDKTVQVLGPDGSLVFVYKGVDRESYSCTPQCERRITLGDAPAFFGQSLAESGARTSQAQSAK